MIEKFSEDMQRLMDRGWTKANDGITEHAFLQPDSLCFVAYRDDYSISRWCVFASCHDRDDMDMLCVEGYENGELICKHGYSNPVAAADALEYCQRNSSAHYIRCIKKSGKRSIQIHGGEHTGAKRTIKLPLIKKHDINKVKDRYYRDYPEDSIYLSANRYGEESYRLDRLQNVLAATIGLSCNNNGDFFLKKLAGLHDHKGTLFVHWRDVPTLTERRLFYCTWNSVDGDGGWGEVNHKDLGLYGPWDEASDGFNKENNPVD